MCLIITLDVKVVGLWYPEVFLRGNLLAVFPTLVSTAGEDRGEVLEGLANSLVLFWQSCGEKDNMSKHTHTHIL